jgi:hypothetical protein
MPACIASNHEAAVPQRAHMLLLDEDGCLRLHPLKAVLQVGGSILQPAEARHQARNAGRLWQAAAVLQPGL